MGVSTRSRAAARKSLLKRVRRKICHDKCGTDRYHLDSQAGARPGGMRSNITMLYGHIETAAEEWNHTSRTRAAPG